jgi:hypothetical protein
MRKLLTIFAISVLGFGQDFSINIIENSMEFNGVSLSVTSFSNTDVPQIPGPHIVGNLGSSLTIEVNNLTNQEQHFNILGLDILPENNGWPIGNGGIAPLSSTVINMPSNQVGTWIYTVTTQGAISIESGLFGIISIVEANQIVPKIVLSYEMDSAWHLGNEIDTYHYNPDLFFVNHEVLDADSIIQNPLNSFGMSLDIELVNMGYLVHRYEFNELTATLKSSDANELLAPIELTGYFDVFPGERYQLALGAHLEGDYVISLHYLNPISGHSIQENHIIAHFEDFSANIGDINLDGNKNILDLVIMIDFLLGEVVPSETEFFRSDMNSDGQLTVQDIVILVNLILFIL